MESQLLHQQSTSNKDKMKTRQEVARYINSGELSREAMKTIKHSQHFGKVEVRLLLDYVFDGKPKNNNENVVNLG